MLERQNNKSIEDFLSNLPENYFVLEEEIDVDIQMKYMKFSDRIKEKLPSDEEILSKKDDIFNSEIPATEKKLLLTQIASVNKVEAYRLLEKYKGNPDKGLENWSILAFHESKMLLHNSLSDTKQVFIASGLGGKANKLRFFVVLFSRDIEGFSDFQKNVVKNEFETILQNNDSEFEKVNSEKEIITFTCLVPIKQNIQYLFKKAVKESNQYGDFLKENILITNVKKMSFDEIREFIIDAAKNNEDDIEDAEIDLL